MDFFFICTTKRWSGFGPIPRTHHPERRHGLCGNGAYIFGIFLVFITSMKGAVSSGLMWFVAFWRSGNEISLPAALVCERTGAAKNHG
jgi:hypothetical protein